MKLLYIFSYIICMLLFVSCQVENGGKQITSKSDSSAKKIAQKDSIFLCIDHSHYDFGTVSKMEIPELIIDFKMKNNGKIHWLFLRLMYHVDVCRWIIPKNLLCR